MVDSVFISVDNSLGRRYASPKEYACKNQASCLHAGMFCPRISLWNTIRPRPGNPVRTGFERHDRMDYSRAPLGFHSWRKQLFLRNTDYADCFHIDNAGKLLRPK